MVAWIRRSGVFTSPTWADDLAYRIGGAATPGSLLKTGEKRHKKAQVSSFAGQRKPSVKSPRHLAFVRRLPCVCCVREPAGEAAHVRMASAEHEKSETGIGRKPDDRDSVPLCGWCHREGPEAQHKAGEAAFWDRLGIDPIKLGRALWALSGDFEAGRKLVLAMRHRI